MAKYTSKYAELAFYVDGELRKFYGGVYNTSDKAEIAVLDSLVDANREADEKPVVETVEIAEEAPKESAPKAASQRKASGK